MAAQIAAEAHAEAKAESKTLLRVDTQSKSTVEAESTMPDIDDKPPRRLHDLALA